MQTFASQRGFSWFALIIVLALLGALGWLGWYAWQLDGIVRERFEGKRWEIPAKVYARPLELYPQAELEPRDIIGELKLMNYREGRYDLPGYYQLRGNTLFVHSREFRYASGRNPQQVVKVSFANKQVTDVQSTAPTGDGVVRLEPITIGGIYPRHNEDRVLVQLRQVPRPLIAALVATEDRQFFQHHGVSVRGIARAIATNFDQGRPRQGGSTLTQQLVKNFYLTPERTFKRKANEALMALLLEQRYTKAEILETYLNEINLGQNGNHSINGFGLAAQFYFGQPIAELNLPQSALLVGLVKGPSQYNPWRNPKAALERRNTVLQIMLQQGIITEAAYRSAREAPLGVLKNPTAGRSLFPDFLDVVRRQLRSEYQDNDLTGEGLSIYTTLDPQVQMATQAAFDQSLKQLIKARPRQLNGLQGSAVVADPQNGELLAVVGGDGLFTGYNRAVDAKRQIGSLVKPAVYLAALQTGRYTLMSPLDDGPIEIKMTGMPLWRPKNYDLRSHGEVPFATALANSYNQATIHLGMQIGVPAVINTLRNLGVSSDIPTYPSLFLGTVQLSPMQVLSVYQTLGAQGFYHPIRAIASVVNARGETLQRYGLSMRQTIDPSAAYLINTAMQGVVSDGTAKRAATLFPDLALAGKTGTTNDQRDAWFAGYSGNHVAVVWIGQYDNRPTGLSGADGALPMWINVMQRLPQKPVQMTAPTNIELVWLDKANGALSAEGCPRAVQVPILLASQPDVVTDCARARNGLNEGVFAVDGREVSPDIGGTAVTSAPPPPVRQEKSTWFNTIPVTP